MAAIGTSGPWIYILDFTPSIGKLPGVYMQCSVGDHRVNYLLFESIPEMKNYMSKLAVEFEKLRAENLEFKFLQSALDRRTGQFVADVALDNKVFGRNNIQTKLFKKGSKFWYVENEKVDTLPQIKRHKKRRSKSINPYRGIRLSKPPKSVKDAQPIITASDLEKLLAEAKGLVISHFRDEYTESLTPDNILSALATVAKEINTAIPAIRSSLSTATTGRMEMLEAAVTKMTAASKTHKLGVR